MPPALTPVSAPTGIFLPDGYSTRIMFALDAGVELWEKTISPPGVDGGDTIDTTTMVNTTWRTMVPRSLITLTEFSFTAAYDPAVYTSVIDELINRNGSISVHFPDLSDMSFWGYMRLFEPQDHTEGEQPEANVTIVPTNYDAGLNVESAPVFNFVSGT